MFPSEELRLLLRKLRGEEVDFWQLLRAAKVVFEYATDKAQELKDLFSSSPLVEFSDYALTASVENLLKDSDLSAGAFDWKSFSLAVARLLARIILEG